MTGERLPGLQPERTTLAWTRTSLAIVAGSLVVGRLAIDTRGVAALALAIPALVLAIGSVVVARRSLSATEAAVRRRAPLPYDGRRIALLSAAGVAAGAAALAALGGTP